MLLLYIYYFIGVNKNMKKTFKVTGATAGTVLVALSQISPAFADEVAKNNVELKSTELDKQLEEFKKLGIEPTVEKQVIKKTVKSQDELEKARQEIEDKIHQADKANQSALDTTKTHKENVKKEGERLKTEEDEIKAQFPLLFEKDGVRVYGKFNEAGKGSQDYYKDIHVFFDVDSDYEGAVDGVHVYEDSRFEILKGPADILGVTDPAYPNWEKIGLGEKNKLVPEGTSIKLTHVANLDDGRQVDMVITVGKFRTKSDDKPEFLKEFLTALGRGEDGGHYLTIDKNTTGDKQIAINSAFGKQTQLDIQFVDTDGKPVKLVTGLVSTDVDYNQSVTVVGPAFLGNIIAPKDESKLETITWDADGVEVPNTVHDISEEGADASKSIPRGSFVSVLAGDSFSYTHGEWKNGLMQGDPYREDYMKKANDPDARKWLGAYMYADIFGTGSKVNVHKPNIPTQPETTLVEVVGEIEVINHTTYVEDKTGKELSPKDEGILEKKDIPEYEYVRTDKKENGDVEHVYRKSVTTTYVDENGNKLLPPEKGEKDKKDIPGYKFIETKKKENGDIEHVYKKVSKITTYVDESGKELLPKKEGIHEKETINGYEFVKTVTKDNGDVEHVYKKVAEKKLPATSLGLAGGIAGVLGLTGVGAYFGSRKRKK